MKILVDTCVWSKALRRKEPDHKISKKIQELIIGSKVAIIGPVRQELLSGVSDRNQFIKLKDKLSAFRDMPLKEEYFVIAAEFSNICRAKGIQGTNVDFLLCSVAVVEKMLIWSEDKDFDGYAKYISIDLIKEI